MQKYKDFLKNVEDVDRLVQLAGDHLQGRTQDGRVAASVLTRSGIVLLSGYLEGYLRDVFTEFVESVNALGAPLDALPDAMMLAAVEHTASRCRTNPERLRELRRTVTGGHTQSLEPKLFAATGGNPTVDTIDGLFRAIGVPDVIETLTLQDFEMHTYFNESRVSQRLKQEIGLCLEGHSAPEVAGGISERLLELIESNWPPRRRRRDVGYVHQIQELLKKRNRIAHGEAREPITPLDLSEFRDHVVKLAQGISVQLDARLALIVEEMRPCDGGD